MNHIAEHESNAPDGKRVERGLHHAADEALSFERRVQQLVRDKPLGMAFAALAVGFVLGRVLTRR